MSSTNPLDTSVSDTITLFMDDLVVDRVTPRQLPRFGKRAFDVAVALVLFALTAPLLCLLALLVKATSPGPAMFRQVRIGRNGRPFQLLKVRTMVVDAEAQLLENPMLYNVYVENGFKVPPELDCRLTCVGRLLRRTSLDELPQLMNVIRGEMSLVGPRPVVAPEQSADFADLRGLYNQVRPGITGYWQVHGRSAVDHQARTRMDRYYLENWSLWLDFKILMKTLPAVVSRRGAY